MFYRESKMIYLRPLNFTWSQSISSFYSSLYIGTDLALSVSSTDRATYIRNDGHCFAHRCGHYLVRPWNFDTAIEIRPTTYMAIFKFFENLILSHIFTRLDNITYALTTRSNIIGHLFTHKNKTKTIRWSNGILTLVIGRTWSVCEEHGRISPGNRTFRVATLCVCVIFKTALFFCKRQPITCLPLRVPQNNEYNDNTNAVRQLNGWYLRRNFELS